MSKNKKDVKGWIKSRKEKKKKKKAEFTITTIVVDGSVFIGRYTLPNGHTETINTKEGKIDLSHMLPYVKSEFNLIEHETGKKRLCYLENMFSVEDNLVMNFKEVRGDG